MGNTDKHEGGSDTRRKRIAGQGSFGGGVFLVREVRAVRTLGWGAGVGIGMARGDYQLCDYPLTLK